MAAPPLPVLLYDIRRGPPYNDRVVNLADLADGTEETWVFNVAGGPVRVTGFWGEVREAGRRGVLTPWGPNCPVHGWEQLVLGGETLLGWPHLAIGWGFRRWAPRTSALIYAEIVRLAGFTRGWATGCRLRITPAADSRSCTGPASDIITRGFGDASGGRLRGFSGPHQDSDGTPMTHRSVALLFGDPFALALRHTGGITYVVVHPGDAVFWHGDGSQRQEHQVLGRPGDWSARLVTTWMS